MKMSLILEAVGNRAADTQLAKHFTLQSWEIRSVRMSKEAMHGTGRENKDTQSNMSQAKQIPNIWAWTVPGVRGGKASAKPPPPPRPSPLPPPPPPSPPAAASSSSSSSRFSSSPGASIFLPERNNHLSNQVKEVWEWAVTAWRRAKLSGTDIICL